MLPSSSPPLFKLPRRPPLTPLPQNHDNSISGDLTHLRSRHPIRLATHSIVDQTAPRRSQQNRQIGLEASFTAVAMIGVGASNATQPLAIIVLEATTIENTSQAPYTQGEQRSRHPFGLPHALCPVGDNLGQHNQPFANFNDLHEEISHLRSILASFHHHLTY
ncbi:uncharacterized protein G2W53_007953 [Senna tora]|uniref:Uncharacterized protein n=1 Tax=Senna tora TaxID=362788 RepID=A0A835CE73_9FABA|nr:uncharacterized protein G2W53_007953 [Senna tora]